MTKTYIELSSGLGSLRELINFLTPINNKDDILFLSCCLTEGTKLYNEVLDSNIPKHLKSLKSLARNVNHDLTNGFVNLIFRHISESEIIWNMTFDGDSLKQEDLNLILSTYIDLKSFISKVNNLINKIVDELESSGKKFFTIKVTEALAKELSKNPKLARDININISYRKLEKFGDIFSLQNWKIYIEVFQKCVPKLVNEKMEFIGRNRGHKGVICSWMYTLQNKGIISLSLTRQQIVAILNSEIKNINLGTDGKTLQLYSKTYDEQFKNQFLELSGLSK